MAKKIKRYRIQNYTEALGWRYVPCIESSSLLYCYGYLDAINSLYPSNPHRVVEVTGRGTTVEVVRIVMETQGRGELHVN